MVCSLVVGGYVGISITKFNNIPLIIFKRWNIHTNGTKGDGITLTTRKSVLFVSRIFWPDPRQINLSCNMDHIQKFHTAPWFCNQHCAKVFDFFLTNAYFILTLGKFSFRFNYSGQVHVNAKRVNFLWTKHQTYRRGVERRWWCNASQFKIWIKCSELWNEI